MADGGIGEEGAMKQDRDADLDRIEREFFGYPTSVASALRQEVVKARDERDRAQRSLTAVTVQALDFMASLTEYMAFGTPEQREKIAADMAALRAAGGEG